MNYRMHSAAKFAVEELDNGAHVMLIGPHGSGKTKFGHAYAEARKQTLRIIDCDPHLEADDVLGKLTVRDGMWEFADGSLTLAAENGDVLLINEVSVLKASVAHIFHAALNREPIPIRTDSGERVVTPHKDFRAILTMNGDGYAGNYRLSPATVDRATPIIWPYPDTEEELDILRAVGKSVAPGTLRDLIQLAQHTRTNQGALGMPPISTRALESLTGMLNRGVDLERAVMHKLLIPMKVNAPGQYEAFYDLLVGKITIDRVMLSSLMGSSAA